MNDARFQLFQFDAYLFDIDGTLANTRGGVHYNSFHTALREVYGCEGRIDDIPVHGNTDLGDSARGAGETLQAAQRLRGASPASAGDHVRRSRAEC